jgi:hypothetical protein
MATCLAHDRVDQFALTKKYPPRWIALATGSVSEIMTIGLPRSTMRQGAYSSGRFPPVISAVKPLTFIAMDTKT